MTTYTHTGPPQGNGGLNDGGGEPLPPGTLSLRCGFPFWFGERAARTGPGQDRDSADSGSDALGKDEANAADQADVCVAEILRYVRTVFEDAELLDAVRLEAAANPGAWYAWQSYRGRDTKALGSKAEGQAGSGSSTPSRPKGPSEWNWEGVWEERVKRVVQSSLTEASLYGKSGVGDDDVRFDKLGEEELWEARRLMGAGETCEISAARH